MIEDRVILPKESAIVKKIFMESSVSTKNARIIAVRGEFALKRKGSVNAKKAGKDPIVR